MLHRFDLPCSRAERSGVCIPVLPLFYWVAILSKLFNHAASPVFLALGNWGTKGIKLKIMFIRQIFSKLLLAVVQ